MNYEIIEKYFGIFLDKHWGLSNVTPFLLAYIRLLLLFKNELSQFELNVVLERQKQLLGEKFNDDSFEDLRCFTREKMDSDLKNNNSMTRCGMLNRLLFCSMLDDEESDFYYLTEPLFGFARVMDVPPDRVSQILESEFGDFKVDVKG